MRRLPILLVAVLALALAGPGVAVAAPATALCTADPSRGVVPAQFRLDACVSATAVTVRNDRGTPVVVKGSGDLGQLVQVRARDGVAAEVLHAVSGNGVLLLPDEVVRWPLGPGAAQLSVSPVDPAAAAGIVDDLAVDLPRPGDEDFDPKDYKAFAGVVRDVAAAVGTREGCVDDANFLQTEACDVTAAAAIGRSLVAALPRATAVELLPVLLDADNWTAWEARRVADTKLLDGGPSLALVPLALPPAPALPAPVPAAPVVVRAPAPAPVAPPPVPAPSPAPVVATVVPAPAPAPAPAAKPPAPAPKPPAPTWSWSDLLQAWVDRNGTPDANGNGNGHGNGDGKGHNGNGKGKGGH